MGYKSVCLNCRIAFSHGMNFNNIAPRICPQCKAEMINVDYKFKPPKKSDIKEWEAVKYLLEHGFYYQHIYDENGKAVKYPEDVKGAKEFVEKYQRKK